MRSPARATRSGLVTACVVGAVAVVAAILAPGASARPAQQAGPAAGAHACLVMTGSGDAAFTRSFNPYSGSVTERRLHEGRDVRAARRGDRRRGGHVYPWLAQSWKWSQRQQDADAADPAQRQVVGRQATDRRRRRLQPDAGKQDKGRWTSSACTGEARTSSRSSRWALNGVAITLKTPDSQFIAANLNLQFVVPKHIWSKSGQAARRSRTPKPVGSGPFTTITRLTTQDIVYGKNPNYWKARLAEGAVPRVHRDDLERRRAAADPERQGRLDAQLRAERRAGLPGEGSGALPPLLRHDGYPISLMFDTDAVPVQPRRFPPGASAWRSTATMFRSWANTATRRRRRPRPRRDLPAVGHRSGHQGEGQAPRDLRSACRPRSCSRTAGFTYDGSKLIDPKGNPVALRGPCHRRLVATGSPRCRSSPEPPGSRHRRDRQDRARLGLLAPERVEHEVADAALAERLQGSPYGFFYANLHQNALIPSGEDATSTGNWEHFSNPSATGAPQPVEALAQAGSPARDSPPRCRPSGSKTLPVIPLFIGPRWSTYSTKYFHCFASPKNFYGDPIFTTFPDNVLSFTKICPGAQTGP